MILTFLFGSLAWAMLMGFLALWVHRNLAEDMENDAARRVNNARRKAYSQGYEHRAALEFASRTENQ